MMSLSEKGFGEKERLIFLDWEEAFQKGGFGALAHDTGKATIKDLTGIAMLYSRMEIAQKHGITGDRLDEIISYGFDHGWSTFFGSKLKRKKWWRFWE